MKNVESAQSASRRGTIILCGKQYSVEVCGGVCYIEGENTDDFVDRMMDLGRRDIVCDLATLGLRGIQGSLTFGNYQSEAHALHAVRTHGN